MGALQVLVGTHALVPDVITATSAGAVLGTVLAQGRTLAECDRLVEVAKGDLMAMTDTSRVFSEQPWLAGLDGTSMASRIHALVTEHGRPDLDDDWDQLEASAVGAHLRTAEWLDERLLAEPDGERDLADLSQVAELLEADGPRTLSSLLALLAEHPDWVAINRHIAQKTVSQATTKD